MFGRKNRYLMLTVDTEALPKRAAEDHVNRLMWGRHPNGTAGIAEMAAIGDEFNAKHVFFVDLCGAYFYQEETAQVVRWLHAAGQDVQLHTHPEYLPPSFWEGHQHSAKPRFMNQYHDDDRAEFVIRHFAQMLSGLTGEPVRAHRAGSFRWNADSIRALDAAGIPLSFNNSMAAMLAEQSVFGVPTNTPFRWSNGVVEIPMTEKQFFPQLCDDKIWIRLTYPESRYFHCKPWWGPLLFNTISESPDFAVFLLHSWSLLYWDENGYGTYQDDRRIEGYRKLLRRLSKDYDIITTQDFLDLQARGQIAIPHTMDLAQAEFTRAKPAQPKPPADPAPFATVSAIPPGKAK
ncbi:polysaccharide deacetylase [Castellaniella sp.]|uniref:polysaccharide deacetylase n=1 Tax=Castellaniella sp. TaxID=1955812 RepID=UPI002AFE661C|nr:polysaccharide deacetylase [Castellaniella sp.]